MIMLIISIHAYKGRPVSSFVINILFLINMLWLWLLLVSVALVYVIIQIIGLRNERYWTKRGVVFYEKNKSMGPMMDFLLQNRALFEVFGDAYKKYRNEPAIGHGSLITPSIFVIDGKNIQHVLQNDFNSFNHRGIEPIEGDTLTDNILFQNGPRWKAVRQSMSPIFTSSKLKNMYYIIDKSAKDFIELLQNNPERLNHNIIDTLSSFFSAAISGAVFGIGTQSVFDSQLLKMARKSLEPNFLTNFMFVFARLSPNVIKTFGLKLFKKHEDFFVGTIGKVLDERKASKTKQHDFADLCISIQENGSITDRSTNYKVEPTVGLLSAQAFFFFIAGVEPCALACYAVLLELGKNPDYLKMVHEEVDGVFEKHSQLTFHIVNGMEVLEKVYNEALRIHPPVGLINRMCTNDTVLPVGNISISKGTQMNVPIFDVHHDERHYPDPEKFDPERWAPGGNVNKDLYMPFGKGNRLCIGARYATLQVKTGLVYLLRHYTVKSHVFPGPTKFEKHPIQVQVTSEKVELIPRNI